MFNLSLTACSFCLKQFNTKSQEKIYFLNDAIKVKEVHEIANAITLFEAFFKNYSDSINNEAKKQTFSCEYKEVFFGDTEKFKYIYAVIHSGNYGSASEICDIQTREIKYNKKPTDADIRPFYLFVVIPKDSINVKVNKGMLLFQNVGPYGVKTITTHYMQEFFSRRYGITLKCSTIAPQLFIKKVISKDTIKKFIMVKNHISSDLADNINTGYGIEVRQIANFHFSDTMWGKLLEKISYVANGRFNLFEFEQKEYDTLKLLVSVGGRDRTIDLHNLENLSIIEGIPDNIQGVDGHPIRESLIKHLEQVASEYLCEMVLQIR